jgi:MoxR-like ATPase
MRLEASETLAPARARLQACIDALEHGLVERQEAVRLSFLCALAGEHTLLIGPPGTAKSELARRLHTVFCDASYFERLLTRFTVPEEIFGPLSIKALEEDRYERHIAGFLPDASIAFIDEVFKANSAILNALLTLLNEREFDNGAGRIQCPLISVIGATNEVPEDEVAEAFFDRFLLRVPIAPVSAEGFSALLQLHAGADRVTLSGGIDKAARASLAQAAAQVHVPACVIRLLAELRAHFGAGATTVSDRRWVKIIGLLRVAAASEGRTVITLWDLFLLPWLTAPDAARQAEVHAWLAARLGVRESFSPARLTRVVEAFEAQLEAERKANDLDYDASGRLNFFSTELAEQIGDAKGGAGALRMSYNRRRRYGQTHIDARTAQIDALGARIEEYGAEVESHLAALETYREHSLWLTDALLRPAAANLAATRAAIQGLAQRALKARAGYLDLPRLPTDDQLTPDPVEHASFGEA